MSDFISEAAEGPCSYGTSPKYAAVRQWPVVPGTKAGDSGAPGHFPVRTDEQIIQSPTIPKPQFAAATEQEILKALGDPDSNLPLVNELARIVTALSNNCFEHVRRFGRVPEGLLQKTRQTALERLALSMIREALADERKKAKAVQGERVDLAIMSIVEMTGLILSKYA